MYNEHFGLTQAPFRITPDTGLFYTGGGRGDVLDALVYAVTSGEGIVKVVGEVGTGKTMLCRMLEERLPDNVQIAYLANPSLTPEDILHAIALELGLELAPDAPRLQVMHRLQQALLERHAQNRRVVALVEEAQSMPVDTLEEIRLLSNLETKNEKLLQIVLFGQPELDDNLGRVEIRQLRERITHSFQLKPLGVDEIKDYVAFRLRASGYRGRDAFTRDAYRAMSRASEGLTRRVNIIADKAMLAAYAEDTHDVSARHVKVAIQDSEFGAPKRRPGARLPLAAYAGAAAAVAVIAGAVGWYAGARSGDTAAPAAQAAAGSVVSDVQASSASPSRDRSADGRDTGAVSVMDPAPERTDPAPPAAGARAEPPAPPADVAVAPVSEASPPLAGVALAGAPPGPMTAPTPAPAATPAERTPDPATARVEAPPAAVVVASASPVVEPVRDPPPPGDVTSVPKAERAQAEATSVPIASVPASAIAGAAATAVTSQAPAGVEPARDAPAPPAAAKPSAPETVAAPAGAARGSAPGSLLDDRQAHTQEWFGRVNPRHFSIQLLATDERQRGNLEAFLERRAGAGQLDRTFVYRTRINGRVWFGVLFGDFESFSEAREALDRLPPDLKRHQPFIRNIRDITVLE